MCYNPSLHTESPRLYLQLIALFHGHLPLLMWLHLLIRAHLYGETTGPVIRIAHASSNVPKWHDTGVTATYKSTWQHGI